MLFSIFIVLCIVTYSLSSPTTLSIITNDHHDSHFLQKRARNPISITIEDLEVIESVKKAILHYTFETDKIIFVGNTPSYIYYSFNPSDNRKVELVPYSGRWMYEFDMNSRDVSIYTVKKYCADFIDPLELSSNERVVLVDFSMTGDGVFQFKELLKACVTKSYSPPGDHAPEFLNVAFLDVLGMTHYAGKVKHWGQRSSKVPNLLEVFGFTEIRHIIPTNNNAANVIQKFRTAGNDGSLIRLMPIFKFVYWIFPEKVQVFQKGEIVRANIRMIRDYFKDKEELED